ncbi:DUF4097 family beta strand repeat protein [Shewanella sp. WXL01]|uniref:DUF4097 family beta strand repeat-containing protein n=1 Tax=Shewanella sp. WXL01 TaxID=2709721 RepID=UPI0014386ABF|nr:DUF4097 family beta strand repeat-containing protein [Shewanella sp. WXL01]NKF50882.1 DUF4097 family beta strand repeat protein [Shewanella sp. WXL01]
MKLSTHLLANKAIPLANNLPGVIKAALLIAVTLSFNAYSAEQVSKQVAVSGSPNIDVQVQRGSVQIIGWDKNEVSVTGTLDELSEGLIFKQRGNNIEIEDKMPKQYQGNNKQGSNLIIKVPNELQLEAEGVSANYSLHDLQGKVELEVVSGNIEAKKISGDTELTTVSGHINSQNTQGKLELESVSGNIKDINSMGKISYRLVSGDLRASSKATKASVETVSGDIRGQFSDVGKVKVVTVSGDVELGFSDSLRKGHIESVSGNLSIGFSTMPSMQVSIAGGPGGKIRNKLTEDKPVKPKYMPSSELNFVAGSGDGKLSVETISGNITVKNAQVTVD